MITVTDEPQCKNLLSAGQLSMFIPDRDIIKARKEQRQLALKGCPRKWALHYCAGVAKKSGPALAFGIEAHKCIEELTTFRDTWDSRWPAHWTNEEPTAAERLTAKISVLSKAMFHHRPKGTFIAEPTYYLNVPDLDEGGTSFYIKPDGWADRKVFVDWKTTSASVSHSPWVLHDETDTNAIQSVHGQQWEDFYNPLSRDIQANLYAYGLMSKWGTKTIKGQWVYGCKKFSPGQVVRVWSAFEDFTIKSAGDYFESIIRPAALIMNGIKRGIASGAIDSPLLIPHVPESCEFIGKFCDALSQCGLAPSPIELITLGLPVVKTRVRKKVQPKTELVQRSQDDIINGRQRPKESQTK